MLETAKKGVIIDTVYKEFVIWIDRADALDARFPRFNTQSLEKDLFNYFDLPAKDMLYEQVQKNLLTEIQIITRV